MHKLKLAQIGDSIGVVLPAEVLARLKLEKGGLLSLTETPDGYAMTPFDPALHAQLQAGREFMREHQGTFHRLANDFGIDTEMESSQ